MHKEYLAHIDMIYSPLGRKVGCKKLLTTPISMASLSYENFIEYTYIVNWNILNIIK